MHGMTGQHAVLRYLDGAYHVVRQGDFVICAVTARRIALGELRYWSVERQEAYVDAVAALQALAR
ncbi:MAG: DUF2093 domain-containing protein [Alphaproteobacteria bacterium]|nr:DUF2093 domain-containing protein [Alphaproteobacteria bacterium]MCW5751709.1 DUF2093 domain-containing protein [Alphaproteobacteria bacterium]